MNIVRSTSTAIASFFSLEKFLRYLHAFILFDFSFISQFFFFSTIVS